MKTKFYFLIALLSFESIYSQVGINTQDPKATLDINGNLIVRNVSSISSLSNNHTILVRDKSSVGDFQIKEIDPNNLINGTGFSSTAYYASKNGAWSLLNLSIGGGWQKIGLTGSNDTKLGNQSLFTDGVYTSTQSGLYIINYEVQLESGVNLEVLGGKKLGILKNNTLWEEKELNAVRVSITIPPVGPTITIATVPVTSTGIQSIVALDAGDTITFAMNTSGLLPVALGLLTDSKVNLNIYKISN